MVNLSVLVLNQNYVPLNVCNVRRAVRLLYKGKAEMLENGQGDLHTISKIIPMPSVIRLIYMVKKPLKARKLSRREVFARDKFTCQYCGVKGLTLTLDHVVPKHKGGPHLWENITSACIRCNHKKAGMTPVEAGMKLLSEPKAPRPNPYYIFRYYNILEEWEKFIPWSQGN